MSVLFASSLSLADSRLGERRDTSTTLVSRMIECVGSNIALMVPLLTIYSQRVSAVQTISTLACDVLITACLCFTFGERKAHMKGYVISSG